jgi:hypothetical protein
MHAPYAAARLERRHVAEIIATLPDGKKVRSSGYRVEQGRILTVAHGVRGAISVQIRFNSDLADQTSYSAHAWWCPRVVDLAVIQVDDSVEDLSTYIAPLGSIPRAATSLPVQGVGFPLWQLRYDRPSDSGVAGGPFRDSFHLRGTIAALSNWREGTFDVALDSSGPEFHVLDAEGRSLHADSPWEGMSGTCLWANGYIAAVVVAHYRNSGTSRLSAIPIEGSLASLDNDEYDAFCDLLKQLPRDKANLHEILPSERLEALNDSLQYALGQFLPDLLIDRADSLKRLARYCSGPDQMVWIKAPPWAGKTALLASFASNPPTNTDVIFHFISATRPGQARAQSLIDSVTDQAALIARSTTNSSSLSAAANWGEAIRLLNEASRWCASKGRSLVLVVDGLDEARTEASNEIRLIADFLVSPTLPSGMTIIVAGRDDSDVMGDMAVRLGAAVVWELPVSPFAKNVQMSAELEMQSLLSASSGSSEEVTLAVVGTLAVCGGLSIAELAELLQTNPFKIRSILDGRASRIF